MTILYVCFLAVVPAFRLHNVRTQNRVYGAYMCGCLMSNFELILLVVNTYLYIYTHYRDLVYNFDTMHWRCC